MKITRSIKHPVAQRGFSAIEAVLVMILAIAMISAATWYWSAQAKDVRKGEETGHLAREISTVARATREYIAKQEATVFPLDTTVAISIPDLISAGFLPDGFAQRAGTTPIGPFGQGFQIAARRIVDGEAPTAVITETGAVLVDKLARVGVEPGDAPVLALKQQVASVSTIAHKTITASIEKGTKVAKGISNTFTKDLSAWLTSAAPATAVVAALVNFKDLEPGGGPGGDVGLPVAPKFTGCRLVQGIIGGGGQTFFDTKCPPLAGYQLVGDPTSVSACTTNGTIMTLPFGGVVTSGKDRVYQGWSSPVGTNCSPTQQHPTNPDQNVCRDRNYTDRGVLTMNGVPVDEQLCETGKWDNPGSGNFRRTYYNPAKYGVCCHVG